MKKLAGWNIPELMMNYNNPHDNDSSYPPPQSHLYDKGWDNYNHEDDINITMPEQAGFNPSIMDVSPDASFFALDPKGVLSSRHAPLPTVSFDTSPNDPTRLRQEISLVSSTHKNLSNQLEA
ncbi:unnamed protein product [Rhizophagus irregularis]|uniref:Uncharacterized protein n=1 Tax=Rhizophagus irregularis TaxID=588596 RepID=A0A2I1HEJ7_9GLOM|nr:hypothetical protein RhiirA4_428885 [Rhizophagus irregularis]CAB4407294.1 unnamed protein product [Rhizophagus irregularis]